MVSQPRPSRQPRHKAASPAMVLARALFVFAAAASLLGGLAGGLLRAGVGLPAVAGSSWLNQAVPAHAFLMICTFIGTVIGLERAVAVKLRLALAGPVLSGLAGLVLLAGQPAAAQWLVVLASLLFTAATVVVVRRQPAAHTALLLAGAAAWLVGNLLYALDAPAASVIPWWFTYLLLTIAAERLEMTRLMRRRAGASAALYALVGALTAGAAISAWRPVWGGVVFGLSLIGLAAWLMRYDIARRTVFSSGLSRYMAFCLLLGYGWLGVAGLAWTATSLGADFRDAALHGLALGFVFSMMLGHAPVILPAIARVKLRFGWFFYVPLAALHGSLALRLFGGHLDAALRATGAAGNALAILLFALTVVGSILAWKLKYPANGPAPPAEAIDADR